MEAYETLGVLGEGTYGVVVKARHRATRRLVAIKKFKQSDENDEHVRKTSLREVRVLKNLHHLNVVSLLDVFRRDGKLFLVFEYIEYTVLQRLEQTSKGLPPLEVKKFMYQLLRGLDYCHAHNIIHRDVKPENILVTSGEELDSGETGNETSKNILKICDFGFARHLSSKGNYTDYVATRWYRAPELLVGDTNYNKGVDIWAVGCLLAELTDTQPLFPGDSDLDQLTLILQTCGMVPPSMIDIFESNPYYRRVKFPHHASVRITLRQRYCKQSEEWLQFIEACLQTDPANRPSCLELMNFPYFTKDGFKYEYEAELQRITAAAYPNLSSSVSHQNNNNNNNAQQRRPQNASAQSFAEVSLTELITSKQFLSNQRASDDSALPNINATSKNSTMNNHQNNNNNKFSSTASSPTYGNSSSNLNNNNNNNFRRPSESINLMLMGGSNANTNNASLSSLNNPSVGSNNTGLPQLSALWNQYLGNNNNTANNTNTASPVSSVNNNPNQNTNQNNNNNTLVSTLPAIPTAYSKEGSKENNTNNNNNETAPESGAHNTAPTPTNTNNNNTNKETRSIDQIITQTLNINLTHPTAKGNHNNNEKNDNATAAAAAKRTAARNKAKNQDAHYKGLSTYNNARSRSRSRSGVLNNSKGTVEEHLENIYKSPQRSGRSIGGDSIHSNRSNANTMTSHAADGSVARSNQALQALNTMRFGYNNNTTSNNNGYTSFNPAGHTSEPRARKSRNINNNNGGKKKSVTVRENNNNNNNAYLELLPKTNRNAYTNNNNGANSNALKNSPRRKLAY